MLGDALRGHTVLMLAYSTWDVFRQDNELALVFAEANRVLYVEKQVRLGQMWLRRPLEALSRCRTHSPQKRADNLYVLPTPPRVPWLTMMRPAAMKKLAFRISLAVNSRILKRAVDRALDMLRWEPTILWCYEADSLMLRRHFDVRWAGYRVYDEITLFPFWDTIRAEYEEFEQHAIAEADFVLASSRAQTERRQHWHPRVYHLPNACAFEVYSRYNAPETVPGRPGDLPDQGPILMFIGTLDYRIDYDLLIELATERPQWQLVCVGPTRHSSARDGPRRLSQLPNVLLLGEKPRMMLPDYLYFADVSLIPYRITESTCSMFPWKVHEHLAMGKPIVATDLPELRHLEGILYLSRDPQGFIDATVRALKPEDEHIRRDRIRVARDNSWEVRLREIRQIVSQT
jgi:glycosyltransferase involved in cell wall biosynthesis